VRNHRAVEELVALADVVALVDGNVLALRNEIFLRLALAIGRLDDDAALGFVILAEFDLTVDFRDDREVFRTARFKQLGNTRQTTGDVAGLDVSRGIRAIMSPALT